MRPSTLKFGSQRMQRAPMRSIGTIPLCCLVASALASPVPVQAAPPKGAVVIDATANTNIMVRRLNRVSIPASVNQKLLNLDMLVVPARSMSRATIRMVGSDLRAQLIGLSERTAWRLPCEVSGSGFVAWGSGINRGCDPPGPGVVVRRNLESISARSGQAPLIASADPQPLGADALAQLTQFLKVCSVTDEQGEQAQTIVTLRFSDPCEKAMDQCMEAGSTTCMVVSEGQWTSSRSRAFALCGDRIEKLRDQDAVMGFLNSLAGQSTNCVVQVLAPGDALLIPDTGSSPVVAFENDGSGAVISVVEGKVNVVSRRSDGWQTLSKGDTYIASRGERQPTSEWLSGSELCGSTGREGVVGVPSDSIESARYRVQVDPQSTVGDPFAAIYSQYCSQSLR